MLQRTLLCLLLCWSLPLPAAELVSAEPAMRHVTLTGFTRPVASLPLVAESGGKVLAVGAEVGEALPEDGRFARIDPTFIELEREANRVQQAQLRSRIAYDEREVQRHRELIKKGSTSRATLDQLEQGLRNNRLQLDALEVEGKVLAERLARTWVMAPGGWRVSERLVEPGQVVNVGERVGRVVDLSRLQVPFALSAEEYAALRAAPEIALRLPETGDELLAEIGNVSPDFDPATRKRAVELELEPLAQDGLLGGVRAELTLSLPERSGAVLLPEAAIERSYEEFRVTRSDGERISVVRLGRETRDDGVWWRVAAPGLAPGQQFELKE